MKSKIIIELDRNKDQSDSGSGLPDLGHDAYWLVREIPNITWKDQKTGKEIKVSDKYTVAAVRTESG